MRVVAIIQARMGSSRLPGKVLLPLAGKPVIEHVINRVSASKAFAAVVVATTDRTIDDPLAERAAAFGAMVVRGDENDVLSRFAKAASVARADVIMRITADCPLIDPDVLAQMVDRFREGDVDFVTNCVVRTFPRGLDAELFSGAALDIMQARATTPAQREHVTPYLYQHPNRFRIVNHAGANDHSDYRLTLDTDMDLALLQRLFGAFADPDAVRLDDIILLMRANPSWQLINADVEQKQI